MDDDRRINTLIVGAGPAGCVLAARLTEDPDRHVALLDAGPDFGPNLADWPEAFLDSTRLEPDLHSWGYIQMPNAAGRELQLPRARVFGGSTAINGAMWIRGSRKDYETWAELGNEGWGWETILPAFKRAEADPGGSPATRGEDGPVTVFRATDDTLSPSTLAFRESAQEIGLPWTNDINGQVQQEPCIGYTPKNLIQGHRLNSALSYLAMARERPNLEMMADRLVDRVVIENGKATGVLTSEGEKIEADRVIVCSGTYGSPAILLRSGIGPRGDLEELGIEVVQDLPGVGQRMLDHPQIARQSGLVNFILKPEYEPAGPTFIDLMVKARSSQSPDEIDLHFYPGEAIDEETGRWVLAYGVSLQYARSEGTVKLTARDPEATLAIDHRHLSDPADLTALCDGYELLQRLVETPPLSNCIERRVREGDFLHDRSALEEIVKIEVGTTYHPSSSCRMGPASDPMAVVDGRCQVRGVNGLHVVDAAIFPTGPRANLHFTVCAVAEHAAALLG